MMKKRIISIMLALTVAIGFSVQLPTTTVFASTSTNTSTSPGSASNAYSETTIKFTKTGFDITVKNTSSSPITAKYSLNVYDSGGGLIQTLDKSFDTINPGASRTSTRTIPGAASVEGTIKILHDNKVTGYHISA
ncbi:hypothetical protein [Clostridium saccharoperbutylacetonicum]|uniref:hypothetical protein n=1 Tax=Clostridium saccharoperbutylacetonicum TaxID=36745 RepID=UPI000983D2ED|nr:hypothetical protein [Clostridium saccharoperbutylacetonicum]AQR95580.1 hypothetical protein CLSAP_28960 [Clostridium saccharoperbutylacetonicum]NSB31440.1 hypothetical protein [Clostridium saccharoperbutylacetonicum]